MDLASPGTLVQTCYVVRPDKHDLVGLLWILFGRFLLLVRTHSPLLVFGVPVEMVSFVRLVQAAQNTKNISYLVLETIAIFL